MGPEAWQQLIGHSAWDLIMGTVDYPDHLKPKADELEEKRAIRLAAQLTRANEVGFQLPTVQPIVSPHGTKILWPSGERTDIPVLTAAGLQRHWDSRGHGFLILRTAQLLRGVAGPLLPWLQAILRSYEERCEKDVIDPLPVNWRVFVGGTKEGTTAVDLLTMYDQSPKPNPDAIQRWSSETSGR